MNKQELLEIEIEQLKDRLYNLEEYTRSITRALQRWSDNINQQLCKKKQ